MSAIQWMSLFQGCPQGRVPLYTFTHTLMHQLITSLYWLVPVQATCYDDQKLAAEHVHVSKDTEGLNCCSDQLLSTCRKLKGGNSTTKTMWGGFRSFSPLVTSITSRPYTDNVVVWITLVTTNKAVPQHWPGQWKMIWWNSHRWREQWGYLE